MSWITFNEKEMKSESPDVVSEMMNRDVFKQRKRDALTFYRHGRSGLQRNQDHPIDSTPITQETLSFATESLAQSVVKTLVFVTYLPLVLPTNGLMTSLSGLFASNS